MARCIRVYANGDSRLLETVNEADTAEWVSYNRTYRPGNALIVDSKVLETGYFTPAQAEAIAALFKDNKRPTTEEIAAVRDSIKVP